MDRTQDLFIQRPILFILRSRRKVTRFWSQRARVADYFPCHMTMHIFNLYNNIHVSNKIYWIKQSLLSHEKTNNMQHMQKQRRRSAAQLISAFVFDTRQYNSTSTYIQNFKTLAFICVLCQSWSEPKIVGFLMRRLKV